MPSGCAVQNKQKPHCASLIVFDFFFFTTIHKDIYDYLFCGSRHKTNNFVFKGNKHCRPVLQRQQSVCVLLCREEHIHTRTGAHRE